MSEMWTDKHKPQRLDDIAGQGKAVSEISAMMNEPKRNAMLLFGPPGCGKTLTVEALAKEKGYELMQLNASEKRNLENINTFSQTAKTRPLFCRGKVILIDEVDGISGRDRGSVGAIADLIKEAKHPVFLVANDPWDPKLRPLRQYVKMVKYHKVPLPSIAKRLREICEAEGIEPEEDALKNLARFSQGDMRSAIMDLQMVAQGKRRLESRDLESLGFRERESSVFDVLPTVFKSRSLSASRKAVFSVDMDADEMFWWIENNMQIEFSDADELAGAFEILAKADMFRSLVVNQQNWRFKGYMTDMMAGVSLAKKGEHHHHGFTPYQPPKRFADMAKSRKHRADMKSATTKMGGFLHCSTRKVVWEYLPFMRIMLKKDKKMAKTLDLEADELKAIR